MSEVASPSPAHANPRVAVIVPAYGVAEFLGAALDSVLAQSFQDWECVVIDDGAPDDVAGAVAPYLADPRIRFLATANQGVAAARNTAIAASTAPLVALLDGDDLIRPDYLAEIVRALDSDPRVRLVTVNAEMFGAVTPGKLCFEEKQGKGDGVRGTLADVLDRSFGVYIGSAFRRADFDRIGGFDAGLTLCEDLDLWVQLMLLGGDAYYVDRVLADYRVRAGSASSKTQKMLTGVIEVYQKAQAALPADAPEQPLLARLIAENEEALEFERAVDQIVAGNAREGVARLRKTRRQVQGPVWTASFALWRLFPGLARPMLSWRRQAHARGGAPQGMSALSALVGFGV